MVNKDSNILVKHLNLSDEQEELLNKILSGLLPHENHKPEVAGKLQTDLMNTLYFEEVFGIYYLIYKSLNTISDIKGDYGEQAEYLALTKEMFDAGMQHYVWNVIRKPEFNAKLLFSKRGVAFNLQNPNEFNNAVDYVYSEAMDLYEELYEMKIPTEEALLYIPSLRESLKISLTERCMNIEAAVLTRGVSINGRTFYGPEDCLYIRGLHQSDMQARFTADTNISERELDIRDYRSLEAYRKSNPNKIEPLAYLGYDPVDKIFPIRTQDIISIIADEGVGKTRLAVDWVHNLLMNKKNVLVITGETDILKFHIMTLLNHIYYKEKKTFTQDEYNDRSRIPHQTLDELQEWNILIDGMENDLVTNPDYGRLLLKQNVSYEKFYEYVKKCAIEKKIDVVVVDHVAVMNSDGSYTSDGRLDNNKKRIDWLYRMEDILTKELNLCFINTVHTQTDASNKIQQGKAVGVRIAGESSSTTKYSTLSVLLRTTPELRKQDIYILEFKKVRDYQVPASIALCRNGATCSHWFDPRMQHYVTGEEDNITASRINNLIEIDEEEFEEQDTLGLDI